jgi:beta-mannosidase
VDRNLSLAGVWRAAASEPDLSKTFADVAFDDSAWAPVTVPHHWRNEPAFAETDGPLLYRRQFSINADPERRWFVEFDGIFYYGDAYFDGEYLGATEGYFLPHAFELTEPLRTGTEHVLAIEVGCPPQRDRGAKRALTGGYWHSPMLDPDLNPGGIWRDVRLASTGPVRIEKARVLCTEASVEVGRLTAHLALDAGTETREVRLHAIVRGPNNVVLLDAWRANTLAAGTNELEWTLSIDEPPRWWPRTLGPQTMCTIELIIEVGGVISDARTFRTAFREIRRKGACLFVNGERLFAKGASYGPARPLLGAVPDELVRADIQRAIDAHLDLLRVHTHVAAPALYDAADDAGVLLWQDLPMTGGFARGARKQAARQARALVELLGHHPSIAVWCAHDAPLGDDTPARIVADATLPTWGKEVLDRSTARAFGRADGTRPVVRSSGGGDDMHVWFGWRHGDLGGLASALRLVPRVGRFVSAFGAQAVPATDDFMRPERWPQLDWDLLEVEHGFEREAFSTHVPPDDAKSFDEWRDASQAYQAALLQLQIEDLRRCKGAPTGGFAIFTLADAGPVVGFGLLDHERVPKRAYGAVRDACRPVLATVDPRTGSVHIVNDGRVEIEDAEIEVSVDGRVRRWRGSVDADAIAYVGRVDLDDAVDVEVVLTHASTGRVANRYPLLVLEAGRRNTVS